MYSAVVGCAGMTAATSIVNAEEALHPPATIDEARNQPPLEEAQPTREAAERPAANFRRDIAFDYIFYVYIECRVDWHHYCDGNDPMDVPSGWQACKPLFVVKENAGNASYSIDPSRWFTVDPVTPVSFKRYTVQVHARGNNIPPVFNLPSQGAVMRLEQVGIRLIAADASYTDRFANGCVFPPGP
jgi:hypothetical protein